MIVVEGVLGGGGGGGCNNLPLFWVLNEGGGGGRKKYTKHFFGGGFQLLAARHCLANIYQVNVSSAVRPYSFVLHAKSCLPSAVFHTHVKIECFN